MLTPPSLQGVDISRGQLRDKMGKALQLAKSQPSELGIPV